MMKLTKREKIILILFALLLVGGGYYYFILTPQLDHISSLEDKAETYTAEIETIKKDLVSLGDTKNTIDILSAKIDMATVRFFPSIKQEKIITVLDRMLKEATLSGNTLNFTEIEVTTIEAGGTQKETPEKKLYLLRELAQRYSKLDNTEANQESEEPKDPPKETQTTLEKMTTSLTFEGTYNDLYNLLLNVEGYNKKILIQDMAIQKGEGLLSGSMTLDFYSIPKLLENQEDEEFLSWDINGNYGKTNPFN